MNTKVIVLAAGVSSRMGRENKLLLPYGNKTVLSHSLGEVTKADVHEVILVTGHDREKVIASLGSQLLQSITECYNSKYEMGQVTSIQGGLSLIDSDADAIMICLGDMPLLRTADYDYIIETFKSHVEKGQTPIVRPGLYNKIGHPVIWHSHHMEALRSYVGKDSMKECIKSRAEHLVQIEIHNPAHYLDMDTPEAYQQILALRKSL